MSYKNKRPLLKTDKFSGFIIGFNSCRPKSLGEVKLRLENEEYYPAINPNYLSDEKDIHDFIQHLILYENFHLISTLKILLKHPVNIDPIKASDKELLDHFKSMATTIYHPCGTCRMSKDINSGVVSDKIKSSRFREFMDS